jgi:hypothetical protein
LTSVATMTSKPMNALPLPRDRAILAHTTEGDWIPVQWDSEEGGDVFLHVDSEWDGMFPESLFDGWEELPNTPR